MVLFGGTTVFHHPKSHTKEIITMPGLHCFSSSEIHHEISKRICPFDLTFNSFKVLQVNCWWIFHGSGDYFLWGSRVPDTTILKDLANQKWINRSMNLHQSIVWKFSFEFYYIFLLLRSFCLFAIFSFW